MRRLTLLVAAATARPDKNASTYFDAAETLWPPTTAGDVCVIGLALLRSSP